MNENAPLGRPKPGRVFWFFGLSGAGKTTLASGLASKMRERGFPVLGLDGDQVRAGVSRDLSFSDVARTENIRRAAEIAKIAMEQGHMVIAAFITPRERQRLLTREIIGGANLDLIWVDCPFELCRQRDPKGLYRRAAEGNLDHFTGVDSIFEAPGTCDFQVRTDLRDVPVVIRALEDYCCRRLREAGPTDAPKHGLPGAERGEVSHAGTNRDLAPDAELLPRQTRAPGC